MDISTGEALQRPDEKHNRGPSSDLSLSKKAETSLADTQTKQNTTYLDRDFTKVTFQQASYTLTLQSESVKTGGIKKKKKKNKT